MHTSRCTKYVKDALLSASPRDVYHPLTLYFDTAIIVLGPLCSGVWAKETNFIQPLVGGMTFVLLGIAWTSFVMKDSVSDAVIEKNRTTQLSVNFVQSMDNIKYLVTMKPISGKVGNIIFTLCPFGLLPD